MTTAEHRYQFNWIRGVIAIGFWLMETAYFGWNATPQSDAELISDGLAILLWTLAWRRIS